MRPGKRERLTRRLERLRIQQARMQARLQPTPTPSMLSAWDKYLNHVPIRFLGKPNPRPWEFNGFTAKRIKRENSNSR